MHIEIFRYSLLHINCTKIQYLLYSKFSKCPLSASIHFLTRVTRELVTLRSTAASLMLLAALRIRWSSSSLVFTLCGPRRWRKCYESCCMGLELIQRHNPNRLHMSAVSSCWTAGYGTDTFLLCVMFARLSELRSVIQGSIPELILSQNCNTVYVHMGPICNGCWVWNSWSVVAHFTRDGVNNTRNFHLWDRDNPHGTVESNYQHLFAVNVWFGVIGDKLIGHFTATSGRWYLRQLFANELPALSQNVPLPARRQMC